MMKVHALCPAAFQWNRCVGQKRGLASAVAWEELREAVYGDTSTTTTAPLERFDQFCDNYRHASSGDLDHIYNSRDPASLGQRLKVSGDYPGLQRHAPVHHMSDFSWASEVESATGSIRDELTRYIQDNEENHIADDDSATFSTDFFSGAYGNEFNGVALVRQGKPTDIARSCFPQVMELLTKFDLAGGNRLVFFARQRAQSGIPPHSDCTNYLYTAHLGIHIPTEENLTDAIANDTTNVKTDSAPPCGMMVGGKTVVWEEGKLSIIQNAYPHHTWNNTSKDRIVLYFDFWHPDLSMEEKRALTIFTDMKREWEEEEKGGFPNPPPVDDPRLRALLERYKQ